MSNIEWTGKTWNPLSGCSRKSEGCQHCYAETMTKRLEAMGQEKYTGLLNEHGRFNGTIKFDEKALLLPLQTKKPTTYFVNSMSDLFHENVKNEWIDKVFAVMALCPQHTFQILTKRADRMRLYLTNGGNHLHPHWGHIGYWMAEFDWVKYTNFSPYFAEATYLPNVWLGVSVENQKTADERIPLLLETPAKIRFLSCEPLLEKVNLENYLYNRYLMGGARHMYNQVDWTIIGGESGHGARDCNVSWIRSIVHQCKSADVPVFVKQLGSKAYQSDLICSGYLPLKNKKGGNLTEFPEDLRIREFPK